MDLKAKIFDQVASVRTGQKTVYQATDAILNLLDVVATEGKCCEHIEVAEFHGKTYQCKACHRLLGEVKQH